MLITDHDNWPAAEVIAGYRSQSEAEFSFRQLKDPRVVSFSPMFHQTEHNIRVHTFICALCRPSDRAHLMRREARARRPAPVSPGTAQPTHRHRRNRPDLPLHRGRPKARRMTTGGIVGSRNHGTGIPTRSGPVVVSVSPSAESLDVEHGDRAALGPQVAAGTESLEGVGHGLP